MESWFDSWQTQDFLSFPKCPASCAVGTRGFFLWGLNGQCMKLTITLHLVLRLGMSRAIPPVPCMSSGHAQGQLYFYLLPYKLDYFLYRLLCDFQVYPTPLRAVGVGTCSAMARLGAMVTPYVAQVSHVPWHSI